MDNNLGADDPLATRLAIALKRLRARLREESSADAAGLTVSQLSILHRLYLDGPATAATAASLAAIEHVSQQAIAQNVAPLKSAGLVTTKPDPQDGRKTLIRITATGRKLRESVTASRNAWLARAIDVTLNATDQRTLNEVISLLERLADADI